MEDNPIWKMAEQLAATHASIKEFMKSIEPVAGNKAEEMRISFNALTSGMDIVLAGLIAASEPGMILQESGEVMRQVIRAHAPVYTRKREDAIDIAPSNPTRALEIARSANDPWVRCRSLSYAAKYLPDHTHAIEVIQESFAAALEMEGEFNRIVCASTWPMGVLCDMGKWETARYETERLVNIISQEPSPVRRSDALTRLVKALANAPVDILRLAAVPCVEACLQLLDNGKPNRRGESWLLDILPVIQRCSPEWAMEAANRIHGPVIRERAMKSLGGMKW